MILYSPLEAGPCKVKYGNTYLTVCSLSLYCPPCGAIDNDVFTSLFDELPGKKLILGYFNTHHHQCCRLRSDDRGEQIADILLHSSLCLLSDGSVTRVDDRTGHISCTD